MSHPFGDLLTQYRARKHGLSQARLAEAAGYDPSLIGRMVRGTRDLTGPSGRERVLRLLAALRKFEVIATADEANALLRAAQMPPLFDGQPAEAALLDQLRPAKSDDGVAAPHLAAAVAEPTARPVLTNLPTPLTSFIGRDAELNELMTQLRESRLVTLVGPGGAGKTRLAIELGRQMQAQFPRGIWLIELAALADPNLVAQKIAMTLNLRESNAESALGTLIGHLRDHEALLLLDNCEHLVDICAATAEALLQSCPKLRIIATSREALNIAGEMVFSVPSLAFPGRNSEVSAESLAAFAAARLFVSRAQSAVPSFCATDQNAASIAHICQRLDGIPLAIELAASRIKILTPEQIAARLDDRFNLLTGGSRTALPRQQTLRATMDWSYDLLTPEERTLLHGLSVFSGGWTLEAVEQVCVHPQSGAAWLDALTQLVNKSLVRTYERAGGKQAGGKQAGGTRYWLLETIRQYAREKLEQSPDWLHIHQRHLDYVARLAQTAAPHLRDGEQLVYLDQLEAEHDNLRAALEWALKPQDDPAQPHQTAQVALKLTSHLSRFWYLHGYFSEGREWLQRALQQTREMDDDETLTTRGRALQGLCWLMNEEPDEIALYEESLALCRRSGDTWGAAFALRGLGTALSNRGESEHANVCLNESLDLFRHTGDSWGIALAMLALGWEKTTAGAAEQPDALWEEALERFQKVGDRWGIAVTMGSLSYWARRNADFPRATQLSRESLSLFKALGDKAGIAISLSRLGMVAYRRDDYPLMTSLISESLVLQRELGYRNDIADSLEMLAVAATLQGHYAQADDYAQQSLQLWREVGNQRGMIEVLDTWAANAFEEGRLPEAEHRWQECLKIARELFSRDASNKTYLAGSYHGLGAVAAARGQLEQAVVYLEQALASYREGNERMFISRGANSLGRAVLAQGDLVRSRELFREALRLYHAIGLQRGIADVLEDFAAWAAAAEDWDHAAKLLGYTHALRELIGVPVPKIFRAHVDQLRHMAQTHLGSQRFAKCQKAGAGWQLDEAVAAAQS